MHVSFLFELGILPMFHFEQNARTILTIQGFKSGGDGFDGASKRRLFTLG